MVESVNLHIKLLKIVYQLTKKTKQIYIKMQKI